MQTATKMRMQQAAGPQASFPRGLVPARPNGVQKPQARSPSQVRFHPNEAPGPGFALVLSEADREHYRRLDVDLNMLHELQLPAPTDFYQLLCLSMETEESRPLIITSANFTSSQSKHHTQSISPEDVKAAFRRLLKLTHPDIAGDAATEISALLNLAFTTLSDPAARSAYDEDLMEYRRGVSNYNGRPVSFWAGPEGETRAIFVDETTCIGCMQCTVVAPSTFYMEDEYGRARVHTQWGDEEEFVKEAVGACPVDCIYYVDRDQLPLLEYVMKSCKRENVAIMGRRRSGNMGGAPAHQNPFVRAESFLRARKMANLDQVLSKGARMQDEALAAAISRAWLALPHDLRRKGWPDWAAATEAALSTADLP